MKVLIGMVLGAIIYDQLLAPLICAAEENLNKKKGTERTWIC